MVFENLLSTFNEIAPFHLVIVTAILVEVTAIYAFYIYHSFKLSQQDYEVRNRPYLTITKDISLKLPDGGTNFVFQIKNSGKTPAQLLSQEITFLKCKDPGEKFSDPHGNKVLNQRVLISTDQSASFDVVCLSKDKKVGLEIKVKYKGVVFRKIFVAKVLFKLEDRVVYPIDSSIYTIKK